MNNCIQKRSSGLYLYQPHHYIYPISINSLRYATHYALQHCSGIGLLLYHLDKVHFQQADFSAEMRNDWRKFCKIL